MHDLAYNNLLVNKIGKVWTHASQKYNKVTMDFALLHEIQFVQSLDWTLSKPISIFMS